MNDFQKKTQKTPKKEINKALKIKEEYEENACENIQLSTLIRIFEKGLNKKIGLTFCRTKNYAPQHRRDMSGRQACLLRAGTRRG